MPQMAPLMWLTLFFFFLLSYMVMLTMIFFIKPYQIIPSTTSSILATQKPWKL
uniref:ATP synthase F0 subunit 8 n=1 Tax=Trapezia digitalis TaxID=2990467 RepID=UPI0028D0F1A1|nr:ATP synthase F0 subunit 8 [Trapezia digitalis]WMQ53197.1 ATP synthase F0 subunit 8 [Trapezia digitalis]